MRALLLIALLCLDRDGMRRMIRRQLQPVRTCYQQALASEPPGFGGKLVVRFVIGPEGTVSEVELTQSELKSETFQTCVIDAVKKWRFLKPPGGGTITVSYPITFKAAE